MDVYVSRRINFLSQCARYERKRDQAITFTMRVLSNHATIGKDAGSKTIKRLNTRISREALNLLLETDIENFCKLTINEHPKPLSEIWSWLIAKPFNLSPDLIWAEFTTHKMVTVTKEEDKRMSGNGLKSQGEPDDRYAKLGIEVLNLSCPPSQLKRGEQDIALIKKNLKAYLF